MSTQYVTDKDGGVYEHLEYFPFGETWVEEASNTERTPYLFTSKELDRETGLYYYGARYMDPRTSVWLSPDPALLKYIPTGNKARDKNLPGLGGVFNSLNLGVYSYSHQNPIKFNDPDGKATEYRPLTSARWKEYARNSGYFNNMSYSAFIKLSGEWFSELVVQNNPLPVGPMAPNKRKFRSPAREAMTGGKFKNVVPDGVRNIKYPIKTFWGFGKWGRYYDSHFFEGKAYNGTLHLSSGKYQILGLIDAAARSQAGHSSGIFKLPPIITFITTSDTKIGADVITEASRRGVAIYQVVVYEKYVDGKPTGKFYHGAPKLLNPQVYIGTRGMKTY